MGNPRKSEDRTISEAKRDANFVTTLLGVSDVDGITPVVIWADPTTHALLATSAGAGSGTVTSVAVTTANGVSGSVADPTGNAAITLTLGIITPTSVNGLTLASQTVGFTIAGGATPKTLTVPLDATVSGNNTGDQSLVGLVTTDQTVGQTIGLTGARLTKLWATDITATNAIAGSITGNAATATNLDGGNNTTLLGALPYQSNVNVTSLLSPNTTIGQKFLAMTGDGTNGAAPSWQTVPASGVPYTGATADLNLGVHNLLTTGDVGATGSRVTHGWFTDITSTNAIAGSVTGNAGTVTGASITAGKTLTVSDSATIATGSVALGNGKTLTLSDSTTLNTNAITLGGGEVITFSASNALSLLTTGTTAFTFPAGTVSMAAPGTSGNVLQSDGTNWTSAAPAPGGDPLQMQIFF